MNKFVKRGNEFTTIDITTVVKVGVSTVDDIKIN